MNTPKKRVLLPIVLGTMKRFLRCDLVQKLVKLCWEFHTPLTYNPHSLAHLLLWVVSLNWQLLHHCLQYRCSFHCAPMKLWKSEESSWTPWFRWWLLMFLTRSPARPSSRWSGLACLRRTPRKLCTSAYRWRWEGSQRAGWGEELMEEKSKRSSVSNASWSPMLYWPPSPSKNAHAHTRSHIPPLQPIIAALIRAQLAWGIMALPWKQRWGAPSETSGGFNLGLVKIQLIKSETWQDKQHTILTSHWSQCSVVPVHTYTHAFMQTHTLDLAVFVPGAVAPCMDTHGEVKIQNPTSERPPFHLHLTYWK